MPSSESAGPTAPRRAICWVALVVAGAIGMFLAVTGAPLAKWEPTDTRFAQ